VISSHRLGELEKLTKDYIFLYRGEVVSFGDKITSGKVGRLRVELVSNGNQIAKKLLPPAKLLNSSETELVIAVGDDNAVPDLVSSLVKGGPRITGVLLQREDIEDIEDVFLRLYNERN
jgi:ABC-type multidrug transport system ATPase subunit